MKAVIMVAASIFMVDVDLRDVLEGRYCKEDVDMIQNAVSGRKVCFFIPCLILLVGLILA